MNASDLLDAIVRRSRGQAAGRDLPGNRTALVRAYFAGVPEEDLRHRDPKTLAVAALSHVASARSRRRGVAIVRVFNPAGDREGWLSDASIVQLVNDDMPFLVDSITMTLNRLGHRVELLMHPILGVKRSGSGQLQELGPPRGDGEQNLESFIHVEISKIADAEVLKRLRTAL